VGFIRELPEALFAAFRATFEEMADADLLLHVVDAADPDREHQIATTEELLSELELGGIPRLLVFNKADLLDSDSRSRLVNGQPDTVLVVATDRTSTLPLLDLIAQKLRQRWDRAGHSNGTTAHSPGERLWPDSSESRTIPSA
jgi:GTP-binding protein HflX